MNRLTARSRILLSVIASCLMWPAAFAATATFGRTDVGTVPSAGMSADFKRGSRFTVSEQATVHQVCAYLDGNGGASGEQRVRYAIYSDTGGKPANKVLETDYVLIVAGAQPTWACSYIGNTPVASGQYWIALHTSGTAGVIRNYSDGTGNWYGNADSYADGASNPFGIGNAGNGTISVYAEYANPLEVTNAGRITIGTKTSTGMSANFKRASSFTLTERGRLSSMTAYLDTRGGATGTQFHRYALYRDENGKPGTRVAQGDVFGLSNNNAPRWYSDPSVPYEILEPGKYWFAIQTGGVAGVLRNYADGTGNWFGNADAFADGASSPFGAGNTGDGTLSAFITYDRRPLRVGYVGRTDVAKTPSAGLRPNVMRGSEFVYNNTDAVMNSLSAYLDGLGGAAGKQKIRMAVYQAYDKMPTGYPLLFRIAESAEVEIAAGTPPRWVNFPVPATRLDQGIPVFRIVIESGDTGGIVRNYGDGPANWISTPFTYSQGGPEVIYNDTTVTYGTVTLSVYATYTEPAR